MENTDNPRGSYVPPRDVDPKDLPEPQTDRPRGAYVPPAEERARQIEFQSGQARVPDPWEYQTAERHGRVRQAVPARRPVPPYNSLERPERPEDYPPPPATERPRNLLPWFVGAIVLAILVIAVGVGIMVRDSNRLSASVPLIGRDPGVDLCVGIASGDKAPTGAEGGKPMTQAEYTATRDAMGKIRNDDVRSGVVAIVDMAWAIQSAPALAFSMGGDLATAYGRMTTGCATYGVTLPPLNTKAPAN